MNVTVKLIQSSVKPNRLADATVEVADGIMDVLTVSDIRILQNKEGQAWVAMPSRSVSTGGRSYMYLPQVEANRPLQEKIADAVLKAFDAWQQAQSKSEVL